MIEPCRLDCIPGKKFCPYCRESYCPDHDENHLAECRHAAKP